MDAQRPPRHLVVVGTASDRSLLTDALGVAYPEGITAVPARDADEAIAQAAEHEADCVLVALEVGTGAGVEVVRELAERAPSLGIVVVAGRGEHQFTVEAVGLGAHDLLGRSELGSPAVRRSVENARRLAKFAMVERRNQRLLEQAKEIVLLLDTEGRYVWASPAFENVTGFPPEELFDEAGRFHASTHPADNARVVAAVARVYSGETHETSLEYRGQHPDGTWHWRDLTITDVRHDPLLRGVMLTIRDVSDKRRADESLIFQASLLEAVAQPVVATGPDGVIRYWNSAATEVFGWTAAEAIGRHVGALTTSEDAWAELAESVRRTVERGEHVWTGELWLRRKDGSAFPAKVTNRRMVDERGEVLGNIGVTTDLSEIYRAEERMAHLSAVVQASTDAIVSVDLDGTVRSWNPAAERMFGVPADAAVGEPLERLAWPDGDPGLGGVLLGFRRDPEVGEYEMSSAHPEDGSVRCFTHQVFPLPARDGNVRTVAVVSRDTTDLVTMSRQIEAERDRLREAQSIARMGSFVHDAVCGTTTCSDELYEITGLSRDEPDLPGAYISRAHPHDLASVQAAWDALTAEDDGSGETREVTLIHRFVRDDDDTRWFQVRARTEEGNRVVRGTIHDVTAMKKAEERLVHQAHHDALTGLPNRNLVTARLAEARARVRRAGSRIRVALLDLDQFKVINDSLGHATGDKVLTAVGRRITELCGDRGTVGRFGGDEFVVVREEHDDRDDLGAGLGNLLLEAMRRPIVVDGREFSLTASIGITTAQGDWTPDDLLRDADAAMYEAKARGKDQYAFFDANLRARAERRLHLEADLRTALRDEQLELRFQPIVDLRSGLTAGFEGLLRWRHPQHGYVDPSEFIPIAEDSGLITGIGTWVLQEAATRMRSWLDAGHMPPGTWMAVNLSARQLAESDVVETVSQVLQESGLPAESLHLEITESVLMSDVDNAVAAARALADLGCPIAIDDFGTGYSSLAYLKHLPVDVLKVDRSFITGVGTSPQDTAIVASVVELARALGKEVVAEGVEDAVQMKTLANLGCHFGQGYYWSRPVDGAAVPALGAVPQVRRPDGSVMPASVVLGGLDLADGAAVGGHR